MAWAYFGRQGKGSLPYPSVVGGIIGVCNKVWNLLAHKNKQNTLMQIRTYDRNFSQRIFLKVSDTSVLRSFIVNQTR